MASTKYYTTCFLFTLISIICIPNLVLTDTSTSTCPNNTNSSCTALPFNLSNPPDVWLNVPDLSVREISLVVKNITAHVSISASIANLVSINAGVDVSIDKVNLTILGVKAQVQLAVYLDNVAKIVTRTISSLTSNPLLLSVVNGVFKAVNNVLGTITQNGQLIHQIISGTGQILNQVLDTAGKVVSSTPVGDILNNMTFVGITQTLDNGNIVKQYSYPPPANSSQKGNLLVDVLFDTAGNVLSATVLDSSSTPTTTSTLAAAATTTTMSSMAAADTTTTTSSMAAAVTTTTATTTTTTTITTTTTTTPTVARRK